MIYKATKLIQAAMDEKGIKYAVDETDRSSFLTAAFGVDNGPNVSVRFISNDNDNDVAVRLYCLLNSVSEDKCANVLKVINELNCKYRFVKFVLDKDNDVSIECDIPLESGDEYVGKEACEIFIRIMKIADDAYPQLMHALWG